MSLFFICMLMTRFCYLTLDNENLTVHSAGRTIRYPYADLRKVNFDLIIGMDDRNIDDLKERAPSVEACGKIHRMTEYCTKFAHADYVPDPYYGGAEGFEYVLDILEDACAGLLGAVGE